MANTKRKTVGLALSGGVALGGAHIGVLKALREHNVTIDYISGTSVGALVGSLYAFNQDIDEVERVAKALSWRDISTFSVSTFALFSNRKMKNLLKKHIGDAQFQDAKIPLSIIATDISSGSKVVIEEGSVADAVLASTCIPGIFKPIQLNGGLLVDGGIVENLPISPLRSKGADIIIAVDLNAKRGIQKPTNIMDVLINSFHFTLSNASRKMHDEADILVAPNLAEFNLVKTDQTPQLIEVGYKEANRVLSELTDLF